MFLAMYSPNWLVSPESPEVAITSLPVQVRGNESVIVLVGDTDTSADQQSCGSGSAFIFMDPDTGGKTFEEITEKMQGNW